MPCIKLIIQRIIDIIKNGDTSYLGFELNCFFMHVFISLFLSNVGTVYFAVTIGFRRELEIDLIFSSAGFSVPSITTLLLSGFGRIRRGLALCSVESFLGLFCDDITSTGISSNELAIATFKSSSWSVKAAAA